LKPVTALSDAGFLVVGADGGVDVVVDVGAAAGVVDGVAAVVEAAGAVVLGSVVDMGHLFLKFEIWKWVNGFAARWTLRRR
jgi:hypothetical protein